jgi:ATPase family associated with various cellular activities (AAA)/Winged helix domain, variant
VSDLAWLQYVASAFELHVEDARAAWREHGSGGPHAAIDGLLDGLIECGEKRARRRAALGEARERRDSDPNLSRLRALFSLGEPEADIVSLLAATALEPRLAAALGYAEDDVRPHLPTPGAAARLFGWEAGAVLGPGSPLVKWAIAGPVDDRGWRLDQPWALDPEVGGWLQGGDPDPVWPGLRVVEVDGSPARCLHPALLRAIVDAADRLAGGGTAHELELIGRVGSGRRTLLTQVCSALGRRALVIEAPELEVRALRTALWHEAVPIWTDPSGPVPVDRQDANLTLCARERAGGDAGTDVVQLSFTVGPLGRDVRQSLWASLSTAPAPAGLDEWSLTASEIKRAAAADAAGPVAARAQLRRRLGAGASSLMRPVACTYGWEDLIVAEPVRRALRELEDQVRLAGEVLDEWGFRRLTPERRGTTALFAGPSGTGKTMAAAVLACSLGLELYRVDLSQVVDKYIGETEKRLAQVLDECERSRVIVLFDEADALFGQRSRVRDAHDRYANIEIDYLLSRLDSFDGLAILATNRKSDLDPAFMRRIRLIVDFLPAGLAERARLWDLALGGAAPAGERIVGEVDRERLVSGLELSPAEIKTVAINAAFIARAAGELVSDRHLWAAAERELAKRGRPMRELGAAVAGGERANGHR